MLARAIVRIVRTTQRAANLGALSRKLHAIGVSYLQDQRGATAIEYAMIATGIGVALILVFTAIGDELVNIFGGIDNQMTSAQSKR